MGSTIVLFSVSVQQKAVKIILRMLFVFTVWFTMTKYLLKYTFRCFMAIGIQYNVTGMC